MGGMRRSTIEAFGGDPKIAKVTAHELESFGVEKPAGLIAYDMNELAAKVFPRRMAILTRYGKTVMKAGEVVELYASRGVGKTNLLQSLAVGMASGVDVLGFGVPRRVKVAYLDGEMTGEMTQERLVRFCESLNASPGDHLRVVCADWQADPMARLDTPEGQAGVYDVVTWADVVIIDNRSCLFDAEGETDPSAWTPASDWIFSLRRAGKLVIIVHHSNRMGGARGHSKPEDAMDHLIKLTRPEDYTPEQGARFTVEWEKSRGVFGDAVAPFTARLKDGRWEIESSEKSRGDAIEKRLLEYLRIMDEVNERPKSATATVRGAGVMKAPGLKAFKKLLTDKKIIQSDGGFLPAVLRFSPVLEPSEPVEPANEVSTGAVLGSLSLSENHRTVTCAQESTGEGEEGWRP